LKTLGWGLIGTVAGAVLALAAYAPAAWLARAAASATSERLLLADARGTVWQGSAVVVLTGGAGSRDASALPAGCTGPWAWMAPHWACAPVMPAASSTKCACVWYPA
jgi:hypothetical protein